MPLHIIDTAGLRDSDDRIEQEGVRRAWHEIERADRVLLLVDDRTGITVADEAILQQLPSQLAATVIRNKIDLSAANPRCVDADGQVQISLSAKTGAGLELLEQHLQAIMGFDSHGEGTIIARRRHLDAIARALTHLDVGEQQLACYRATELLAEELRLAQQALGEITGDFTSDELLGRIFSSFCIGK